MYDLEVCLPATGSHPITPSAKPHTSEKYRRRIADFKEVGLLNIGNNKVLVKAIICNDEYNEKDLKSGWPDGVDIEILRSNSESAAIKIAGYYRDSKFDNAKWYIRVDDDSITDVSTLLQITEENFDYQGNYYIAASVCQNMEPKDFSHLGKANSLRKFPFKKTYHEWEASLTSFGAMQRIVLNNDSKKYLESFIKDPTKCGDHMLAYIARIAMVYPIYFDLLTKEANANCFTFLGGYPFAHIHYVSFDQSPHILELVRKCKRRIVNWSEKIFVVNTPATERYQHDRAPEKIELLKFDSSGVIRRVNNLEVENHILPCRFWEQGDNNSIKLYNLGYQHITTLRGDESHMFSEDGWWNMRKISE